MYIYMMRQMKILWVVILIVILAIGGVVCYFFNRTEYLFEVDEGVCPRCLSHDVRKWVYGFGVENTDEVCAGGCVVSSDSPKYHCDLCGFDWGIFVMEDE